MYCTPCLLTGGGSIKSERNIFIVFMLNLCFSAFEFFGGIFTGSIVILSDALHDFGDAASVGIAYLLEKKSKRAPDSRYTYGYLRFSVLGAAVTNTILVVGSAVILFCAARRLLCPVTINHDGMILFAIGGLLTNTAAFFFTKGGDSLNQRAVNLHMAEDILSWAVVLVGAVVMKFTEFAFIDPLLSMGSGLFVLVCALKAFKKVVDLFLDKVPDNVSVESIREHVLSVDGVLDVHHIHVRSFDGVTNCATMHIVTDSLDSRRLKNEIKAELKEAGVDHLTLEFESSEEQA